MISSLNTSSNNGNGTGDDVASFFTKADALFRKNLTFQRRNWKMNVGLVMCPFLLCLLMVVMKLVVNSQLDNPMYKCGCKCVDIGNGTCENRCGLQFSKTRTQAYACPIPAPQKWPALFQIPAPPYRSVQTPSHSFAGLPHASCLETASCPVTSLFTGQNSSTAQGLVREMAIAEFPRNWVDLQNLVSLAYLGTYSRPGSTNFVEQTFLSRDPLIVILPRCIANFSFMVPVTQGSVSSRKNVELVCVESSYLWRENSSSINRELFQGYRSGNSFNEIHEILGAYDFLNSSKSNFNVTLWYNSTYCNVATSPCLLRIPRSLNMVSNAYLRHFKSGDMRILLGFVKEMPRAGSRVAFDLSSIGPLLFAWVIQLLFPVFLIYLVHEKQYKLRIMMKMHGLGDGPYWLVSYIYFLLISSIYMIWFAVMGSIVGLEIFRLNNYAIQFIFYFVYLNLQIALAFLAATLFSEVKTAAVLGYIYVFGSGLLGAFFFQYFVEDTTFSRSWLMTMELLPGFSLYQGLYELSQYALAGHYKGTSGMTWENLNDKDNGMKETLVVMTLECMILLIASYYLDQVVSSGNGVCREPLFFLGNFWKKRKPFKMSRRKQRSTVFVDLENPDISEERHKVEKILNEQSTQHPIVCHNLKKVYIGRDQNYKKHAVENLSIAIPFGECFGLLGPNGAGKTTFIKMLTGFLQPTSGTALINGMDIISNMNKIYTKIGVCPQHDLIWENLTGREHLLFYGRVRNLKGTILQQAVDDSLKGLNLYQGNVGDQLVSKYSGGMKRRLSVAIALIGDTQVVFMDEPTTGLDPESRNNLWHVVKTAKTNRAIILTTHSMEEAEFLCDRLGIMVGGSLHCVGSSKELKSRYGGSYILTISANPIYEKDVEGMVSGLTSNAVKIYNIGGTQKFRLPKQDVKVFQVFEVIEDFKRHNCISTFGLSDASLEDVFTKVVHEASNQNSPDQVL